MATLDVIRWTYYIYAGPGSTASGSGICKKNATASLPTGKSIFAIQNVGASSWPVGRANSGGTTKYVESWIGLHVQWAGSGSLPAGDTSGNDYFTADVATSASTITVNTNSSTMGTASKTTSKISCDQSITDGNVTYYINGKGTVTLSANSKTGYHFNNWSNGVTTSSQTIDAFAGDQTITANFAANTYTAKFNSNGGSASTQEMSCDYGQKYNTPNSAGTKDGYAFVGWGTSKTSTSASYTPGGEFSNLTSTNGGTKTLYAVWTEVAVATVTYDGNGGTPGKGYDTVIIGNSVTLPSCSSPTGYTFNNQWEIGGSYYSSGESYTVNGNVTAYAVHRAHTYTVVYHKNNNDATGTTASSSHSYGTSKTLTKNGYSLTGYTFAGWATSAGGSVVYGDQTSVLNLTSTDGDTINLYAKWTVHTYLLSFDKNNSSATGTMMSQSFTTDVAQQLNANAFSLANHTFSGWGEASSGSSSLISDRATVSFKMTGDKTLYAYWKQRVCAIIFSHNDGTGNVTNVSKNCGDQFSEFPSITRDGYDFAGWWTTTDNTGIRYLTTSIVPDADTLTLYAHWSEKGYYIDFDLNGSGTRSPLHVTYGNTGDIPGELTPASRNGYKFLGWELIDANGVLSGNAKWWDLTTPITEKSIPSDKFLKVAASDSESHVYVKNLSEITDARITMKALWKRVSHSITVDNSTGDSWSVAVNCTTESSASFEHFNGTGWETVDPTLANASVAAGGTSSALTMWAGLSYKVSSTYTAALYANSFKVLTKWGGSAVSRDNSGSSVSAAFSVTKTIDATESSTTWTPTYSTVTANVSDPCSLSPIRTLSFSDNDSTGKNLKASAASGIGISFNEWSNVQGTVIGSAHLSDNPVNFSLTEQTPGQGDWNNISLTASYGIVKLTVSAEMDAKSLAACTSETIPTIKVNNTVISGSTTGVQIDYGGSATFKIEGISSSLFQFGGWWADGESVARGSTSEFTVYNITDNLNLFAKLKAKIALGKQIEEETSGTVSASLVLNGTEYIDVDTCSAWVTIGDTYSIGCITKNANSIFVCWYDANLGSKDDPKDYSQYQDGIEMLNNVNLNAYILDNAQEYYIAVYNKNLTSGTYSSSVGQVMVDATLKTEMTSGNYKVAASVMKIPNSGTTLVANCVQYLNDETHVPEWSCKVHNGDVITNHRIRYESRSGGYDWKYYHNDTVQKTVAASAINDETISFPGDFTVVHTNPLKLGSETSEAANGQYYVITGTQRIKLSIAKIGSEDLLRTKRFNVLSTSIPVDQYSGNETSVTSIVNQNFVFLVEWGPPQKHRLTAAVSSSEEQRKGTPHIGSDASEINRGELYESGLYEYGGMATVYANPRNGYRFSGWYDNLQMTGDPVSTDAYYYFVMEDNDITLYAKFVSESIALYKWEGASTNKLMVWKSKVYALSKPANINSARVDSTGYQTGSTPSLNFKLASYSSPDESPRQGDSLADPGISITSQTMRRLPPRRPERFFQVTVQNDHEIDAVILGTSGEGIAV